MDYLFVQADNHGITITYSGSHNTASDTSTSACKKNNFLWVTSTGPGGFMDFVSVFYDGSTRRLNRKWFMEKPGIEPATPG